MKKILTTGILIGLSLLAIGQKSPKELKGDKFYNKFDYTRAIDKYERLDSTISTEGLRNLAESYRLTFATIKAEETYSKLIDKEDSKPIDYYYYAYVLKENKKYLVSDSAMSQFQEQVSTDDLRVIAFLVDKNKIEELKENKGQFVIKNLDINSAQEDFGTVYYNDQIVLASSREGVQPIRRRWNGNNLPFLDLYVADKDSLGTELKNLKPLTKVINKKYHEGPASFAKGGRLMAFTTSNYTGKSEDGTIKFNIFFSELDSTGKWTEPTGFYLNDKEYSVGHPCLTEDGKTMYFASDIPGGYGLADIYKVEKISDTLWGEAKNMGPAINTEGNEMFPYFQEKEKILFLASDGHVGLGGLDLFVSQQKSGTYKRVENIGAPINSNLDDFAFLIDEKMEKGYFSSNREGGKGDDDIYSFNMLTPFMFGKKLQGVSRDKEGEILSFTKVKLFDSEGNLLDSTTTNEKGEYEFSVEADKDFVLTANKEEYFDGENKATSKTKDDVIFADLELNKDPKIALHVLVTDKKTGVALDSVTVRIVDNLTGETLVTEVTDSSGDVLKGIEGKKIGEDISYTIHLTRTGYFPKVVTFKSEIEAPGVIDVHKMLDFSMDKVVADLAELIEIHPINFDLNKYDIRPDAEIELNKIVDIMNKYPNMIVELGSHTDCRASKSYNEKLSDNRAKASAKYIKGKVPNPDNIYGKGYGELKLLNECSCEGNEVVPCSEEKHAENRRTEFKVISVGVEDVEVVNPNSDSFSE